MAKDLPKFIFEIIGHSEPDDLNLPENVRLLGPKNHPEINEIASRWDAAIIPFKMGPLADAVDRSNLRISGPRTYYSFLHNAPDR